MYVDYTQLVSVRSRNKCVTLTCTTVEAVKFNMQIIYTALICNTESLRNLVSGVSCGVVPDYKSISSTTQQFQTEKAYNYTTVYCYKY